MSYCVECGVKLDKSLTSCPLCHTPVINPNELKNKAISGNASPFSSTKGEVEPMSKRDVALWLTLVFGSTVLSCGILNLFVFKHSYWSIPVIGACIILWLFFCPRMFIPKIPFLLNLAVSAVSVVFYEFAITLMTQKDHWFYEIVLPITLITMILIALSGLFYYYASKSLIATALYFFLDIAFLSVAIELIIDRFIGKQVHIFWSAIVFSVCAVISVALIAILSIKRLREHVRKRLHF